MSLFRKFFSPRTARPHRTAAPHSVRVAAPSIRHEPPAGGKKIHLALQGGGSHGAFTWGVLDYLLEDGRLAIAAVSGASAGAVNAVMLADGLARGGPEEARRRLSEFWRAASLAGEFSGLKRSARFLSRTAVTPVRAWMDAFSRNLSPYDFNPLNINPLRQLVQSYVDFEAVRGAELPVFISATDVQTGRARIFTLNELNADVVAASAALPSVFRAVMIDNTAYWDGGYSSNPPLLPFLRLDNTRDVLLVQIKPVHRPDTPTSSQDIAARISEIGFNAALHAEMRALALLNEQSADPGRIIRMHRVALPLNDRLGPGSALDTDYRLLEMLRETGRQAAQSFLQEHFDDIGERATLDVSTPAQGQLHTEPV
jgi:NTE family protein